jgi:hypothetical protein
MLAEFEKITVTQTLGELSFLSLEMHNRKNECISDLIPLKLQCFIFTETER